MARVEGLATLPVRIDRACATARALAQWLAARADVERVHYPGLDDASRPLADALLGGRGGGTLAFEPAGGRARAKAFQEALRLVKPAASLGGTHSLLVHSASVTHTQLSRRDRAHAGISESLCRLSVGLEDAGDLVADLDQALESSGAATDVRWRDAPRGEA